jgi:hypothetical protein
VLVRSSKQMFNGKCKYSRATLLVFNQLTQINLSFYASATLFSNRNAKWTFDR